MKQITWALRIQGEGESDSKSHWAEWHWCVGRGGVIGICIRVLQRNRTDNNIQVDKMVISAQAENVFALPPPFCCIQALSGLDEVLPLGSLCCLLNQMLISSRNTLIDTPRNNTFTICLGIAQPSWYIKLTISVAIFGDYFSLRHPF